MKKLLVGEISFWQRRINTISGTTAGGLKASETNKRKHGADFYKHIGRLGGIIGTTGGFASNKVGKDGLTGAERASIYGTIGGRNGKRGPARRKKW